MPIPGRDPTLYDSDSANSSVGTVILNANIPKSKLGSGEFSITTEDCGVYFLYGSYPGADVAEKIPYNLILRLCFMSNSSDSINLINSYFNLQSGSSARYTIRVDNSSIPQVTIKGNESYDHIVSITKGGTSSSDYYVPTTTSTYNSP